jgi:alpha-methylacyl-CoA racemase
MPQQKPLKGVRILSLALNLPGPAALRRLADMGARCIKINPPKGDPMASYTQEGYDFLNRGIKELSCDLKSNGGQKQLHRLLKTTDVLLTSFRPSALTKLGLSFKSLHSIYPSLSCVSVVGGVGPLAEIPGHDLTYQTEAGLVPKTDLPASLFADMGGAIMASEAVLKAVLMQSMKGKGIHLEVSLSDAAAWMALPRDWGMTLSKGAVGGAHAGYNIYPCKNGRVAVAALESHFAKALCEAVGIAYTHDRDLYASKTHQALTQFFASHTRRQLEKLASDKDIPMMTLPPSMG